MKNLLGLTISGIKITKGTPNEVWLSDFNCSWDKLESLEGCPKEVHGDFICYFNELESLENCPKVVYGDFDCSDNNIESFEYGPQIVYGDFDCSYNKLKSLKDIHKHMKEMNCVFNVDGNPIKSHVLGLLLVNGCKGISLDNEEVEKILNKYLPNNSGMKSVIQCQSDLLDAGLEEFAQL